MSDTDFNMSFDDNTQFSTTYTESVGVAESEQHNDLGGRSESSCHPMSAITGLVSEFQSVNTSITNASKTATNNIAVSSSGIRLSPDASVVNPSNYIDINTQGIALAVGTNKVVTVYGKELNDFVVNEVTSDDGWKVRIWKSGRFEATISKNISVAISQHGTPSWLYYSTVQTLQLPDDVFTEYFGSLNIAVDWFDIKVNSNDYVAHTGSADIEYISPSLEENKVKYYVYDYTQRTSAITLPIICKVEGHA